MYQLNENTVKSVLQRKFSSLVGCSMEEIDNFQAKYDIDAQEIALFKKLFKKLSYESMRDIESQLSLFSQGVKIGVSLNKPTRKL